MLDLNGNVLKDISFSGDGQTIKNTWFVKNNTLYIVQPDRNLKAISLASGEVLFDVNNWITSDPNNTSIIEHKFYITASSNTTLSGFAHHADKKNIKSGASFSIGHWASLTCA